jgi:glycosyltransferase involved in cell wall biosynthesis
VMIEAFALGRPVIASRAGGPLEVLDDGVSGWFFEPGDVESLAGLLSGLTPADVSAAGLRARGVYESRYRPDRFRAQIAAQVSAQLNRQAPPRSA